MMGQHILHELRCEDSVHLVPHHEYQPPQSNVSSNEKTVRICPPITHVLHARTSENLQGTEWRGWQFDSHVLVANFADLAAIIGSLTSAAVVTEYGNTERKPLGILSILTKVLALMGHDNCSSLIPGHLRSPSADTFVTCSALWILCGIWHRHRHQGDRFQDQAIIAGAVVSLGGHLVWSIKWATWDSFGIYVFFFVSVAMCLSLLGHGIAENRRKDLRLIREEVRGFEDAKFGSNGL